MMEQTRTFGNLILTLVKRPDYKTEEVFDVVEGAIGEDLEVVFDDDVRLIGGEAGRVGGQKVCEQRGGSEAGGGAFGRRALQKAQVLKVGEHGLKRTTIEADVL